MAEEPAAALHTRRQRPPLGRKSGSQHDSASARESGPDLAELDEDLVEYYCCSACVTLFFLRPLLESRRRTFRLLDTATGNRGRCLHLN